ncbi:COX15/CtaA family protein [Catellatospora methionotrophica]|uniref:COX15/CtaA family protein n=1 Tax=Catellatospora methionotrophica TaxID=121620 RepID=UPI0033FF997E
MLDADAVTRRRLALAGLAGNIGIVVTGGAVRLTGSGLGCPTWPKCTEDSYTATRAMGINGAIEFGNRLLTFVLSAIAIALVVAVWRHARLRRPAVILALGIPGQGVVGGITVLTDLNPYVVGLHFLLSAAMIGGSYLLWQRTVDRPAVTGTAVKLRPLTWALTAASAAVVVIGVVVTGSGPHAGDDKAHRTGLNPEMISQLHVDAVFLMLGLAVACWFAARAVGGSAMARASAILLGVLLAQGAVGFVQYFTHLPPLLVGAHMAGACAVWVATLAVVWATGFDDAPAADGSASSLTSGKTNRTLVTVR